MRAEVSAALAAGRMAGWEGTARAARSPEQAVRGFEEILLQMVVRAMRRTVGQGGLFRSQPAHGVYEHFVEQALSTALANRDLGMRRLLLPVLRGRQEHTRAAAQIERRLWPAQAGYAEGGSGTDGFAAEGKQLLVGDIAVEGGGSGTEGFAAGGPRVPLSAIAPPTDDPWLDRPDAGRVLLQLMGADTEAVAGGNR